MTCLLIRHLSGARATAVDVVDVGVHTELIFGRATTAAVRFDAQKDRMVGRFHARLTFAHPPMASCMLSDLLSRNGTFVNGEAITASVEIVSGDIVQLGREGPCLEIRIVR